MTTSSHNEVEDIFSDSVSDTPLPEIPTAQTPAVPVDYAQPTSVDTQPTYTAPVADASRKRLFIAIGVAALLLLAVLVIGIVVWMRSGSAPNTPTTPTVNTTNSNPIITNTSPIETPPSNQPVDTGSTFIDTDHDGLSDEEEVIANTNPKKQDTDDDGLSDREEIRVYNTDPRNPDTDNDTYNDGDEVANFYHPNSPDPKQRLFDLPN